MSAADKKTTNVVYVTAPSGRSAGYAQSLITQAHELDPLAGLRAVCVEAGVDLPEVVDQKFVSGLIDEFKPKAEAIKAAEAAEAAA